MAIITSFATLQVEVADYLDRSDLTTKITGFISRAEDKIIVDLTAKGLEKRVTTASSDEYIDLPDDFIEMVHLQLNTDPIRQLKYLSPQKIVTRYPNSTTGKPYNYTIIGETFQVRPIPDASYTFEMAYKYKLDRLSASNTTNWLIDNYSSLYLYASLSQAEAFITNDERVPLWKALYTELMDELVLVEANSKNSGSSLRMTSDTETP